jgi:hypothetical protein
MQLIKRSQILLYLRLFAPSSRPCRYFGGSTKINFPAFETISGKGVDDKYQLQDLLFRDSENKITAIRKNSSCRTSRLLVERGKRYSSSGEIINLPLNRKIVVGDAVPSPIEAVYFKNLSNRIKTSQLKHLFSTSGERKISVDAINSEVADLEDILGEATVAALFRLKNEFCHRIIREHWGLQAGLKEAGAILSWLSPQHTSDPVSIINGNNYSYTDPHCDKANNFNYDVAFLLYLSSEFEGGGFLFYGLGLRYVRTAKSG